MKASITGLGALSIFLPAIMLLAGLSGCVVGSDYRRPDTRLPQAFYNVRQEGVMVKQEQLSRWWTSFNDPLLTSLIKQAAQANIDLRIAAARVKEARALYGIADSDRWPMINALGSYNRSRTSENTPQAKRVGLPGGITYNIFQAGTDASWEIDLFGGSARAAEAASADIEASEEALRMVMVTLCGDVAKNYIEFRGVERQIALTRLAIQSQQNTFELVNVRYKAGLSPYLDVTRAEALMASTRAILPLLEKSVSQSAHRIAMLLGKEPGVVIPELLMEASVPVPPKDIVAGLPSDLLLRRPDIRRSERELAAASARIGIAISDLFPKFSLTGSFGLQSGTAKDLDSYSSRFWSAGPAVRWPLFAAGRIRANIKVQDASYEQAVARYEQVVLSSLEEVENALAAYYAEQDRVSALAQNTAANRAAKALTNELYARGLVDFLSLLEAERSLLASESQLVQSEAAFSSSLVTLYKALGGGWEH